MTVDELIKILKTFRGDQEVLFNGYSSEDEVNEFIYEQDKDSINIDFDMLHTLRITAYAEFCK